MNEEKEYKKEMGVLHPLNLSAEKKDTVKLTGVISLSAIIGRIFHIPSSIVTAKFLGPSLLGVLAIINLISEYAGYTHLGLLQSLPRDVPIAYGKGDKKEARLITNIVYTGFFISSGLSLIILWVLFILGFTFKGTLNIEILILVSIILIGNRINSFLRSYVKAEGTFMIIGKLDLILQFSPLILIPAVIFFKLNGVLFVMILSEAVSILYYIIGLKKPKFHFYVNIKKTLYHLRTGFTIFINSISDSIFWSVDLVMLSALMTTKEVGLYSIALAAIRVAEPFSQGVNMIVYRKIMIEGGKFGTSSRKHFRKYTEGLFVSYLMFNGIILGLAIILNMMAVKIILTKYLESLPVMIILAFGYMVYTSRVFLTYYLNVSNQLEKRLLIIAMGLGINILLDYFLITNGFGITGVAFACSFSFLFISVIIIGIAFKQIYGNVKSAITFISKICMISAILTGIILAFNKFNAFNYIHQSTITTKLAWGTADFIVKGLLFSLISVGTYFLFFKQYHIYKELKPIMSYVWFSFKARFKLAKKAVY